MTKAASNYYNLAKPRMVYGNLLTTLAAFLFACRWHFAPLHLLATLAGLGLVIGSACVFNNYFDRDIDKKMSRTKSRALAMGDVSHAGALVYGALLGLVGFFLLYCCVNALSAEVALVGFIFYVFLYTPAKRFTCHAALIGSVSGAVPIVVGYTAAANALNMTGLVLFLILALWQIPHFDAIAMYRLDEYKAAGIPVLPTKIGARGTKAHAVAYMFAFVFAVVTLFIMGEAGYNYLIVVLLVSLAWFALALKGFKVSDDKKWARKLFFCSLIVLVVFSVMLAIAPLLP